MTNYGTGPGGSIINHFDLTFRFGHTRMHIMRDCLFQYHTALVLPKYSPMTTMFNAEIRRLTENGVIAKWIADEMNRVGRKVQEKSVQVNADSLSLGDLRAIFIALGSVLIIASFTFFCEVLKGLLVNDRLGFLRSKNVSNKNSTEHSREDGVWLQHFATSTAQRAHYNPFISQPLDRVYNAYTSYDWKNTYDYFKT